MEGQDRRAASGDSRASVAAVRAAQLTRVATSLAAMVGRTRLTIGRHWPGSTITAAPRPVPRAAVLDILRPLHDATRLVDRRPFDEDWFEHDGLRLHYETHGRGDRVLVYLHGLLLDGQMNRRLAADLADRGHRVVLLDLPGHGRSDHPRHASVHRMDRYADLVPALLDEIGVDQAVVGGVSLGAGVALQVADRAPDRVAGMVLEMPVLERAVPSAALVFLPLLLTVRAAEPVVGAVAAVARRVPSTGIGLLDTAVATLGHDPRAAAAVLHGTLAGPVAPTLEARSAMTMPTLVIGHRLDAIHPFTDAAHLVGQLPAARLAEARSILELRVTPSRLTSTIAAFLDEVWGEDAAHRSAV